MKHPVPEFSRPLQVDRVPKGGSFERLAAEPEECVALATRLGVLKLHRLTATLQATPWRGGGLKVMGTLTASLDQVSVISLEAFTHEVSYPVERYFLPSGVEAGEEDDADPIVGGEVDLGEIVAETLALDLEPYPRKPGEEFGETIESQEQSPRLPSPFAALSRLRED